MSLEDLRNEIDETDAEIVRLIVHRVQISERIGEEKKDKGRSVRDPERENRVLRRVEKLARDLGVNEEDISLVYKQIIAASRSVQGISVAFQGEIGAYSEVPVKINGLIIALGLMTEKPIEQGKSVSVHGQVLSGVWGAFTITIRNE